MKIILILLALLLFSCDETLSPDSSNPSLTVNYSGNCKPAKVYVNNVYQGKQNSGTTKTYKAVSGNNTCNIDNKYYTFIITETKLNAYKSIHCNIN